MGSGIANEKKSNKGKKVIKDTHTENSFSNKTQWVFGKLVHQINCL